MKKNGNEPTYFTVALGESQMDFFVSWYLEFTGRNHLEGYLETRIFLVHKK